MCFRAEAENVKKGYNHATLNTQKAPHKKNGKSRKSVPKTAFEKDTYEHATQENTKKSEKCCFVQSL